MFDHFQGDEAVGQQLELPARVLVGGALAKQGGQMGFHAPVYLLVRARLTYFGLEHRHPLLAKLAPHPLNRAGANAQDRGQFRGRAASGGLIAVQQNLNVAKLRRLGFVFFLPPLQGLAFVGRQVEAIQGHNKRKETTENQYDHLRFLDQ